MTETLYRSTVGLSVPAEGRTMVGWALRFGEVIDVYDDPFVGPYRETFAPGAFARTLEQRARKVRLLLAHDLKQLPLGSITKLEERPQGLWLEAALADTAAARDVQALARDGHDLGLSICFVPIADRLTRDDVVERTEVKLLEVSVTGMPAFESGEVVGIRSRSNPAPLLSLARRRLALLERDPHVL